MTPNKGISTEKKPLNPDLLNKLEVKARQIGKGKRSRDIDTLKSFLLFRYAGLHPRVLGVYDYKKGFKDSKLMDGTDQNEKPTAEWDRPKKKGAEAHTVVPKHPNIDFDITEYYAEIKARKSKYKRSPQYFNYLMKDLGDLCNIRGLSPLSFRHSLAVEWIRLGIDRGVICDTLNISPATLRKYGKFAPEDRNETIADVWFGGSD